MAQGQRKITVKFQPVGHKALERAINNLAKVQKKLENNVKNLNKTYKLSAQDIDKYRQRVEANTKAADKNSTAITRLQSFVAQYRNKLLLAAFAVTAYSKTIGMLTKLYSDQEMAEKKLAAQLGYTSQALLDFASAQQNLTTYGDEVTIQAMSQVSAFTKNETAIKGIIVASQNLASGLGIDFNSAVTQLTKSIFSNTNALSRQGIEFDNTLRGSQRYEAAIASVQEKFAGQAQTEAGTYSGKLDQLGDSLGDLGENVGEVLAEALLPFVKGLRDLTEIVKKFPADVIVKGITAIGLAAVVTRKRLEQMAIAVGLATSASVAGGPGGKSGKTGGSPGVVPIITGFGKNALKTGGKVMLFGLAIEGLSRAVGGLFNMFSSGDESIKKFGEELTGLDKVLFENQNDIEALQQIHEKATVAYDNETKALEKLIETRKKEAKTKYGTKEMKAYDDPFTSFFAFGMTPMDDQALGTSLGSIDNTQVLDAEQDLNDHLQMRTGIGQDLVKINNALTEANNKNAKAISTHTAELQKEIKLLEDKANFKGADFEIQKKLNQLSEEGVTLDKDQIKNISDLIQRREDLKQSSKDLVIAEKELASLRSSEGKYYSEYVNTQKKLTEVSNRFGEAVITRFLAGKDATEEQNKLVDTLGQLVSFYEAVLIRLGEEHLDVPFASQEQVIKDTKALIEELTGVKLTEEEVTRQQIANIESLKSKMQEGTDEYNAAQDAIDQLNDDLEKMGTVYAGVEKFVVTHIDAITNSLVQASIAGEHMGLAVNKALIQIAHTLATKAAVFGIFSTLFGFNLGTFSSFLGFREGGHVQGYNMGGYVNPQSFSGGGYVDTVPAMLTEGEFVMSRRAVDSIGVENLNRMNREGTAGQSINISFSGNVMSDDFIESEAIPKIKDAIRRGADIGVS